MGDKKFAIITIVVTLLIMVGAVIWATQTSTPNSSSQTNPIKVPEQTLALDHGYNVRGLATAPITLVEFSDPQCPACRVMEPNIIEIVKQYPTQVRVIYRHFPLPIHNNAIPASQALEAAGKQGKFFPMLEALFANQEKLSDDKYIEIAQSLDLNIDQFNTDRKSQAISDLVMADKKVAMDLNLPGTPTLFINGEQVEFNSNISPIDQLKAKIDPLIANAIQVPDATATGTNVATPSAAVTQSATPSAAMKK